MSELSIISLGKNNHKLLYPVLASLLRFLYGIGNLLFHQKVNNGKDFGKHPFIIAWIVFLSEAIIIILYYIQRKQTKSFRDSIMLNRKTNYILSLLLILVCFFLHCILNIATIFITIKDDKVEFIFNILSIISMSIFSMIILHYKYYQYHFLGGAIIIVGLIIHALILESSSFNNNISSYFLVCFIYLVSSLIEVIEKYLIDIQFINPFLIISIQGIIGTVVLTLVLIVFNRIPCPKDSSFCDNETDDKTIIIEDCLSTIRLLFFFKNIS